MPKYKTGQNVVVMEGGFRGYRFVVQDVKWDKSHGFVYLLGQQELEIEATEGEIRVSVF